MFRRMRILSPLVAAMAVLFSASAGAAGENEILFKEDFSGLPLGSADGFGRNSAIREEGGLRFLAKENMETEFFFGKESAAGGKWIDYRSRVRFRFPERCTLSLVVKAGGSRPDAAYLWYYIGVGTREISVSCHNLKEPETRASDPRAKSVVRLEESGLAPLTAGTWITLSVDVGETVLKVRLATDDGQTGAWEFPVFPGTGGSQILAIAPTDIAEFVVEQLPDPVAPAK